MGNAALGGRSKAKRSQVTLLTSAPDSSSQHFINAAAACDQPAPVPPSSAKNDKSLKKVNSQSVVVVHVEPDPMDPEGEVPTRTIRSKLQRLLKQLDDGVTLDPKELREGLSQALSTLCEMEDNASSSETEVLSSVSNTQVRAWLATTFTRQEQVTPLPPSPLTPKERFKAIANIIIIGKFFESMLKDNTQFSGPPCTSEASAILKEELGAWHFPIFKLECVTEGNILRLVGHELFKHYNIFDRCSISPSMFGCFLAQIEIDYGNHGNPYHNATHGADVAQTVHYFISQTGLKDVMTHLDIMAMIFSALVHDVNHPGTSNQFQIATKSPLALLYSDRSVLEYHHLYHTFKLMLDDRFNLFSGLSSEDYKLVRGLIVEMVLGTDMSSHFAQVKNMKHSLTIPHTSSQPSPMFSQERAKTFAYILHVADISHPAKEWAEHEVWSDRLCEEFFRQGDREKKLGMKISPMCGRDSTNLPESQIGFINYIVAPAFEVIGQVFDFVADMSNKDGTVKSHDHERVKCATKSHDNEWVWHKCIGKNKETWTEKKDALKAAEEAAAAENSEHGEHPQTEEGAESQTEESTKSPSSQEEESLSASSPEQAEGPSEGGGDPTPQGPSEEGGDPTPQGPSEEGGDPTPQAMGSQGKSDRDGASDLSNQSQQRAEDSESGSTPHPPPLQKSNSVDKREHNCGTDSVKRRGDLVPSRSSDSEDKLSMSSTTQGEPGDGTSRHLSASLVRGSDEAQLVNGDVRPANIGAAAAQSMTITTGSKVVVNGTVGVWPPSIVSNKAS